MRGFLRVDTYGDDEVKIEKLYAIHPELKPHEQTTTHTVPCEVISPHMENMITMFKSMFPDAPEPEVNGNIAKLDVSLEEVMKFGEACAAKGHHFEIFDSNTNKLVCAGKDGVFYNSESAYKEAGYEPMDLAEMRSNISCSP